MRGWNPQHVERGSNTGSSSRATSLEGFLVLRDFDSRRVMKQRSEELRTELDQLMPVWKTIADHGTTGEVDEVKQKMEGLRRKTEKGTKRKGGVEGGQGKQSKRMKPSKCQWVTG